ncbi:MAG: hypothetical protein RLZZ56_21, partial [Actinomycetota bacterium]
TNLRTIERNANHTQRNVAVVGDVGQLLKTWNSVPNLSVENFGNLICHTPRLTT